MFQGVSFQNIGHLQRIFQLFLLSALLLILPRVTGQSGFEGDIPPAPYDVAYDIYFRNYPALHPCILTASLGITDDVHNRSNESRTYMGCTIGSNAVRSHALVLLSVAEAAKASTGGCDDMSTALQEVLRDIAPPDVLSAGGIGLVLSTDDENATVDTRCDMTCFLAAVQNYNIALRNKKRGTVRAITAVIFSDKEQRYWFSGGRRTGEELSLPREVTSAYDFGIFYVPNAVDGDWAALMKAAAFNRARWSRGRLYPQSVLETRNGMALVESSSSAAEKAVTSSQSCVESSSPSCVPLGGWTVWASTADMNWRWNEVTSAFTKTTKKGAIALLVASTTVSLLHGATPGADGSASAVVATLSVLEALRRLGDDSREVYAFFFPGEHVGGVGSARFMSDATLLECARAGLDNCTALAYKDNLNFTTVNFSAIDTFLVVDQVAYPNASLYYHVDARVRSGPAQERAEAMMNSSGVHRAATSRLPYSPITTLLDLFPDAAVGDKVLLTLTRYNTTYANPNVFTIFDAATRNSALSAASVAEAADVMLRVLLAPNVSSSSSSVKVNRSVVDRLWECFTANLRCGFLSTSDNVAKHNAATEGNIIDDDIMAPDFGVSAMTGGRITPTQEAIEASLQRLGWKNIARSPAVPKSLLIPLGEWGLQWERDETWMRQHNDTRYTLQVMSFWRENIGARSTLLGSEDVSLIFLFFTVVVGGCTLMGVWVCLK